jgi:RimJ/RimL family protein N-acetyltransferase
VTRPKRRIEAQVDLREVEQGDLETFFQDQRDPDANVMAAFPPRDRAAFQAHWSKILHDRSVITKSILVGGDLAGNIVSWEQDGKREVGYWVRKSYWGRGIATTALTEFLRQVKERPLYAHVAKHNLGSIRVLEKCGFALLGEDQPDGVSFRLDP